MSSIAVTGVSGLLGSSLVFEMIKQGLNPLGLSHKKHLFHGVDFDIFCVDYANQEAIYELFRDAKIQTIIHCAAITNLNKCERDPDLAQRINVEITRNLVIAAARLDIHIIYISTDSVYKGDRGPWLESNAIFPANVYAKTKQRGEAIISEYAKGLVLRTNFFGKSLFSQGSLASWALSQLSTNTPFNGFSDVVFSPLYVNDLAKIILAIIKMRLTGIYNLGAQDSMTKYEFCCTLADFYLFNKNLITSISIDEFPSSVARPKNTALDSGKFQKDTNITLPSIQEGIEMMYSYDKDQYLEKLTSLFGIKGNEVLYAN